VLRQRLGARSGQVSDRRLQVLPTMVELQPGIAKLEFAMGSHGLEWKAGGADVVRVSCQARLLGVKPGWSINMINGVGVKDSNEIWTELNKCKKAGRKYTIYFVKDKATIVADQAKAEAEKAKKEAAEQERREREESERKNAEEAKKKREEDLANRKQEYWDKTTGKESPPDAATAVAEAAEPPQEPPPADEPPAAEEGGGDAPAEEAPAEEV